MKLTLSPRAEKQLRQIPKVHQLIVAEKIRSLPSTERSFRIEKLRGYRNIYRVRVGDYRLVYRKTPSEIYIILIGHRREIYKLTDRR